MNNERQNEDSYSNKNKSRIEHAAEFTAVVMPSVRQFC